MKLLLIITIYYKWFRSILRSESFESVAKYLEMKIIKKSLKSILRNTILLPNPLRLIIIIIIIQLIKLIIS